MSEINLSGIAGVIIWTSKKRFQSMEDFYINKLGLVPLHQREYFVNFKWPGDRKDLRLTISVHSKIQTENTEPDRIMINFHVADIHATAKHLSTLGITFIRLPEQESWGGWIATIRDPDSNTVQLLQSPNETSRPN